MSKINSPAVVGAGVMGKAISRHYSNQGYGVVLIEVNPSQRELAAAELKQEVDAEEEDSDSESNADSTESERRARKRSSRKGFGQGRRQKHDSTVLTRLNMRQVSWNMQHVYDYKLKRDAVTAAPL